MNQSVKHQAKKTKFDSKKKDILTRMFEELGIEVVTVDTQDPKAKK